MEVKYITIGSFSLTFMFVSFLSNWSLKKKFSVTFLVVPQIQHFDFGNEPVNEGETVSVQCTILKGDSPLNITWKLNKRGIASGQGIVINNMKRVSLITLESVHAEHAGTYECIVANKAGVASYSSELNINGIWDAVTFDILGMFTSNEYPNCFLR